MDNKQKPKPEVKKSDLELVREEMHSLEQHPGWKRIADFLQKNIDFYQYLLNEGQGENETMTDVYVARASRNLSIQFHNLPELMVEFQEKAMGQDVELDPYDKTTQVENSINS